MVQTGIIEELLPSGKMRLSNVTDVNTLEEISYVETTKINSDTQARGVRFRKYKGKYFEREIPDKTLTPAMYGIKAGLVPQTAAFKKMFAESPGCMIKIDAEYLLDLDGQQDNNWILDVPSNTSLFFEKGAGFRVKGQSAPIYQAIRIFEKENISVFGGHVVGDRETHTGVGGEWGCGMYIGGSKNINVTSFKASKCWGDGITISHGTTKDSYCENISLFDVESTDNRRQGLSIISVKNLLIDFCRFNNTHGTAPQAGIDIEPDVAISKIENITIRKTWFEDNAGPGLWVQNIVGAKFKNILIDDCDFVNNIIIANGGTGAGFTTGLKIKNTRVSADSTYIIHADKNILDLEIDNVTTRGGDRGVFVDTSGANLTPFKISIRNSYSINANRRGISVQEGVINNALHVILENNLVYNEPDFTPISGTSFYPYHTATCKNLTYNNNRLGGTLLQPEFAIGANAQRWANDSDVLHKTGAEDVSGVKRFLSDVHTQLFKFLGSAIKTIAGRNQSIYVVGDSAVNSLPIINWNQKVWSLSSWTDAYSFGIGPLSLQNNTGTNTTAAGVNSGRNNTGSHASAVGVGSMENNTGNNCVGLGSNTLRNNNYSNVTGIGQNANSEFLENVSSGKPFNSDQINIATKSITVAGHGFGSSGSYVNLKFKVTSGTAPSAMVADTVYQLYIVDANTLSLQTLSDVGNGTFSFVNSVTIFGSTAVGRNAQNTRSYQVMLGAPDVQETFINGSIQKAGLDAAPQFAASTGRTGELRITPDYIYFCGAPNTWKRAALISW